MMTPEEMRTHLEEEFGTGLLPDNTRDLIWSSSWENGNAYGYWSVRDFYMDFTDVAKASTGAK